MTETLLNDEVTGQIKDVFRQMQAPVQVFFFGRKTDCDYCADTLQLAQEVVALSDKLSLEVYDIEDDAAVAQQYRVDKTPGLVLAGKEGDQVLDYGIRFAGIPSGHEFGSLIPGLILISNRNSGLNAQTREFLRELKQPVHLQVFVTPT
jgi:alkyl hydroperoxide reductase subunit AhpF